MDKGSTAAGALVVGAIIGVLIAALVTFVLLYIYSPRCGLRCGCFAESSGWDDYEPIIDIEKSFSQDLCVICREELKNGDTLYRAPCGHKFHKKCLKRWLQEDNRCPMCNDRIELAPILVTSTSRGELGFIQHCFYRLV